MESIRAVKVKEKSLGVLELGLVEWSVMEYEEVQ